MEESLFLLLLVLAVISCALLHILYCLFFCVCIANFYAQMVKESVAVLVAIEVDSDFPRAFFAH